MPQLKPILVKRRTGMSIQPFRAELIKRKDAEQGVKEGTLIKVEHDIYEEVDVNVYQTKVMEPQKKVVRKKKAVKKEEPAEEPVEDNETDAED